MKYTVVWSPTAEAKLAELWLESNDRADLTVAADRIDELLRRDAANVGESRSTVSRILIEPPLAILFDTSSDDRLATVWAVWRWTQEPH
ncbi:hypothetical protein V22_35130 [Calycomorphotria hydatis]|uniref:Plasmid stabilization system protein n=1 Tax=Calycomorphotria hydatis TaxID=2528027 RepID=A0A517TD13_9PLAN|nr:hypothetical protein V22_35130 [Calycomorphotria hydatis]